MIGYILLILITIVAWVALGMNLKNLADKRGAELLGAFELALGLVGTVLFITSSIHIATRSSDAVSFQEDRDYRQELVYSISDTMSPQTVSKIINHANYINEKIERNKMYCDSEMFGFIYNKGIAEVEPIDIPKFTYKITIEE